MLNLCPNENVFCVFHVLIVDNVFCNNFAWCCNFYLLLYLFCLWSFCKDTAILQTHPVLLLDVLSLYLPFISFNFRFIVSIVFLSHVFGFLFFMLYRAKFQGSMFCLEVNQWQVTEVDVPVWSAEVRLAQVFLCLGVCFTSLNSVKQEWVDDSWFLCQSSFLSLLGSLHPRTK